MDARPDRAGRTVVVTGASSGTGAAAARRLHDLGAEVVVVGRDPARTARVAAQVDGRAFVADFAVLDDVRRLADDLLRAVPRIDVLADNAGGAVRSTRPTVDGNEPSYQVNALAPYLLTALLTPRLEASGARVVATSSRSHHGARLTAERVGEQLDDPTGLSPHRRYARAERAALLLHRAHARRHPRLGTVAFHPGHVASDFGRYLGRIGALAQTVGRPFLTSPEQAARRLVHLATAPDVALGRYHSGTRPAAPSPSVGDDRLAAAVHDDARRRLGLP